MNKKHQISLTFRSFAFLIAIISLMPYAVKLAHTFNHYKHEVCDFDNDSKTHFHQLDVDCDFYKFKLNKVYSFKLNFADLESVIFNHKVITSNYELNTSDQKFQILLRGPPIA